MHRESKNFPVPGGRDISQELQEARRRQSRLQGSFPLSQQGEIASQQLWGRRLAGLKSSTSLTLNFLLLKWHQKFVQVQEKKGEKYQALKTDGGRHTLQLVVSWRQGYQACDDDWGSPNKVTVDIGC